MPDPKEELDRSSNLRLRVAYNVGKGGLETVGEV